MSLNAILGRHARRLARHEWNNREVLLLVQELEAIFSDRSPIQLDQPIRFVNNSEGPAIQVVDRGGSEQALQIKNNIGQTAVVGIGTNSEGLVASDVLFRSEFIVSTEAGDNGYTNEFVTANAGSGRPGVDVQFSPRAGLVSLLGIDRKHYYVMGSSLSVEITSIENDYLIGTIVGTSTSIQVAKPWMLSRTPFDGNTIDEVTYSYDDSQHRTTSRDGVEEAEVVTQLYEVGDVIQAERILNGTGYNLGTEEDEQWVDLNVDARIWAADPDADDGGIY